MQLWGMNGPYHLGVLKISGRMKASLVIVYEIKTNHKSKTQLFIPKTDSKGGKKKDNSPDILTERAISKGHEKGQSTDEHYWAR